MKTLQWKSREIRQAEGGFSSICNDGKNLWLLPKDKGEIIRWERKSNTVSKHNIEDSGFKYTPLKVNFHSGIHIDEKVWLVPFFGSKVLSFDLKTGKMLKDNAINRYLDTVKAECQGYKFRAAMAVSGCIYLLCRCTGCSELLVYKPETDKLEKCDCGNLITNADYLGYLYSKDIPILNEKETDLEHFIEFVVSCQTEASKNKEQNKSDVGYQIYHAISNEG